VTATNPANGCTATDQVLVTVNTVVPVANAGNDFTKTCTQNPNGLQIGAAGVAGVTYAWSPNLNLSSATVANPTANPATTTTYILVATNTASGCTATDQVTVTVDLTVPVANAGADFTKNCTQFVNGGTIGVAPVTGVTYSWSPATNLSDPLIANPTANPTVTTTYTLTATNTASGCTLTDQVLVTVVTGLPTANAGADLPITCVTNPTGAAIGMTAVAGITYSWTPTAGLSNPNVSNPTATPTSTTTYTLTATNPTTGCTASDNIIITVNNTLPVADAGADFTKTCVTNTSGLPIGMTAVAGITYSWLPTTALSAPNNANPTANPTATTTYTLTATNPASGCVATDQVVVTVNTTPPTAIAGPDVTVSCASNPSGASIGGPSSGTTTYSWTPSAGLSSTTVSNPTAQPTATTNYTVTATNPANGCTATDQVLVTVNTVVPVANAGNDFTKTCITNALGATVGAASIAGLSYSWSPAAGLNFANISNPIANPTSTTTYTLTTTNIASGCSATDEVTVTVNTNTPTANAGGDFTTTCTQNTTGQVIGMSSVAGVTYSWTPTVGLSDPNVSNPTANPTTTTTYTLTATNTADGCTATDNIVVTVNTVAPSVAAGTDFNKTCLVNPNGLPIGMVQVIGVTYAWSPATGLTSTSISNPVANPTSTQTYTLTATNTANGCTATDAILVTVDIEVPSVNAGADFTKTCAVNASGLGVGMTPVTGVSYAWTPTSGLSSSTIANPIANPSSTTTYTLTATDNSSGCTANDIVVVTVDAILPTINAGADQTICSGSSVTLTASGGNTYSWSNGYANGQAFIPVSTATYTVTGTNTSTGCTNTDQVVVTVNPIPTVANPTDQVLCNNATTTAITFSGTIPGTTFNWTNNNTAINLSAAGSSTVLPFVATNTSNAPVSGTIVVTPVFTSGGLTCTGTTQDVLITVNPTPTVNPIPNQTVCVGSSTTAVTFASTFNVANTSFAWTNNNTSINLGASGNTTVPSFASTNATNGPVTGTVTATPSYVNGGVTCVGTPQSFIITVNPIPSLTNPTDQVVCNNASTNAVNFVGPVAGTSFAWTNSNASINLGITGNGNILPFNATNNTNAAITGNIVVTPSYTNAGTTCTGSNQDVQITVNPTPTVDPILSQGKCVGTSTDAINFSSAFNVTGTTYAWTNSNTAINLPALGNGNIAPFTTTNTGNSPISGNIIVTPSYSNAGTSCPGTTQTFAITVNPIPTVANPTDQVVCNNAATAAIPFTGAVTGTVFNWTNSNTGINLAGSGNGNIFSFNATNNTNTAIIGTLTVTPSYTNAGVTCTGTPQDALITVNPTPTIDPIANQTVCVGSPTSAVNFASTFNVPGTTYAWTNTNTAINLGASGNTNIAAFTSTNAGSTPITGTISVTPSAANAGTTCVGTPQAFTITVNPIPTVSNPADQVVCNNAPTAAVTFSGTIAGTVFNWANNNTAINLGASGNGNISSFNATNTTSSPITGTIVVTPTFTNAGTTCTGSTQDAVITVNPTPTVTDPSDQTVCNGSQVPATVFTGTGTTYNWINSTPSIGLGATGTGNISAFTATNISTNPVVAQVTVTPSFFNAGVTCTGTPNTYSITINPSPAVQFNQPNQTICAGGNTLPVTLTSQTPGATITWSVQTVPAAISGLTIVSGGTSIPSYTLTNSSSVPVTITFLAGASTPGLVNCPGAGSVYTITVNPTPQVNDPLDQVVCHTSSTTAVAFTGSANSYSWTNSTTSIGLAAGGTGNIAAFSAANTTSLPVVSTVVVTPIFTNNTVACSGGTQSFTYTINPTPTVNPTADITLCNGASSTAITFSGTGTSYNWTNNTTSIGLGASGSNTIASFTTNNSAATPVNATVNVTPIYTNGGVACSGPVDVFILQILPTSTMNDPLDQVACNNASVPATTFSGSGTGFSWINSTPSIGLALNGNGNVATFVGQNASTSPITATITVTPTYSSNGVTCPGTDQAYTITVNPTPTAVDPADQVICNSTPSAQVVLSGTGTSYTWSNNTPSIGLAANGNTAVPVFTGQNNTANPVTGIITITPSFLGSGVTCQGPVQTFSITVNPTPGITDPLDAVVCNGALAPATNFTGTGTSYSWTNNTPSIGIPASGSGNIPTFTAVNASALPVVATLTVTPDFTGGAVGCTGVAQTFNITVNPTPTVGDLPDQVICNTTSTAALNFTGTGTSYTWVNSTPSIGLSANGTGDISAFTGTNTGSTAVIGTVTVTPQFANAGLTCSGSTQTISITVNPTPNVTDPTDIIVCNAAPTPAVNFVGTGTSYTWTNSNPLIGLAANGTGNIPTFNAINTGTTPIVATVIVTPNFTGGGLNCTGAPQTFTITINPTPTVGDPADQTVCNNSSTAAVAFAGTGTSYTWVNSAASIGLAASGTGDINAFTATNNSNNPVVATITLTPQYLNAGLTCSGTQQIFTITVNPAPTVQYSLANQTICSQANTNAINITSATPGAIITWSVTTVPSTVTGLTSTSGDSNIPFFTLSNSGTNPAVIQITASAVTSGQAACPGSGAPYTITVNPTPNVTVPGDQVVCNAGTSNAVAFTGTGTSYTWTNSIPGIGLAATGTNTIAPFTVVNTGTSPVVSTISVTPQYTFNSVTCPGPSQNFTITVNPTPIVTPISDLTYCNNTLTNSVTIAGTGTEYTWSNSTTSIGLLASGLNTVPAFTTSNSGASPLSGTVTITPIFVNGGVSCSGPLSDYVITINPTPSLSDPTDQVVCNNTSTQQVVFNGTGTSYTWTNNTTSIGLGASGTGNIVAFTGLNANTVPVIAGINVTAQYTGGNITCAGQQQTFDITVNPTPTAIDPVDQVICNSASSAQVVLAGTGTSYAWTNNTPSIGLAANGNTTVPVFSGQNPGSTPVTGIITITPSYLGSGVTCQGPTQNFSITINPTPQAVDPQDLVVCNNALTPAINFTGTGTSYSWTNSTPSIGIPFAGVGNIPSFTAINGLTTPVIATLTVTPDFTGGSVGCTGATQTFTITINPTPTVNDLPDQIVCNGSSTSALPFTGTGTSYTWVNSAPSIGLSANGSGTIGAFITSNSTSSPVNAIVTVTPQFANAGLTCSGTAQTIGLTVNPTPTVNDPADIVVCNGSPTTPVNFVGTGTSYIWTNSNPLIGLGANGTGNITSFNAVNTGTTPIVATITVTPTFVGGTANCPGAPQSFTITINPTPIANDPSDQVVCNGASAAAVNFGGTGTSYTWVNSTPSIGLSANGTGDIAAFTTTNTSSVPVIGTITLTPQYTNAGLTCSGTAQQFTIAVNPTPVVQDPSDVTLCNNNVTNPITFTGSGTYYNWTNDTPAIGLNATGTGTIPAFLAQNSSTSTPLTAQLAVTAYFEQSNVTCTGNTQTFTISVSPTPVVTDPLDQEVCNGSSTANVVFNGTGTSYTWTNTNTAIGVGAGAIGNIAPFTGLNATAAQISGLFSVTPIYTSANGVACPGNSQEFTIAVNPSPVVTPIPNFTVCNGETINVPLTANITSNFTWYADPNTNVTGDVNIPQPSSTVINTLTNITTTMQYVTYRVNPVSAPQGCSGLQTTFVVEVVPDVELTSDPSIEICSGASVNMILTANVPSTFTWIATDNVNVTGEALFAQSGNIINNLLINNTTQNQIVIYSIIPTSDPAGCVGAARTIAVIVRPPLALLNEDTVTICSGESVDLTLEANVAAGFNWYATNNININGESTTIQTTNLINDVLVNTSNSVQQVDYQAVATSTVNGCASPIFDIVVFVNPLPFVTNVAGAICSGENVNTPITSTQPSIYTWQAQPNGIVTGESIALQNSSTINDVLINTSNSAQIVNYDILPTDLNTGCKGPIFTLPITVNPLPNVSFNTGTGPLCNLTPVPFNNTSDNGLDYAWSFGDGNGSILEDPVYSYPAIGTYTVTLTGTNQQTGCVNSYSTDITLAESPVVDFAASEPEGCVVFNTEFSDLINAPGTSLFWDFGDGETSNQPGTVDHQYPDAGCYDVSLTVTNEAGCTITLLQEDIVCAYAIPDAEFTVSSDSIPIGNPTIEFTNQSTDALTYVWDFGDGTTSTSTNPIHVYPTEPAEYVVTLYAYNELGCYDSMIMTITVWEDLLVYVPNSFTPNEDGTNDVFLPLMTSGFDPNSYELWVFNRWGEVVFYTNDPQAGWDGKYPDFLEELILQSSDNYAQDGVYTWKVQFTGLQNEDAYVYVGTVTLLR
jgi:gliding motility-associated-like protein